METTKTTLKIGSKVYIGTEISGYLGSATIKNVESETGFFIVQGQRGRGRVRPDQCFRTKREALQATVTPNCGGWAGAAQLLSGIASKKT